MRGKIASVSLRDFVTYDYVTFYPGAHLNVIIGPNGTGKSTLVAAIVLGMGGSPKVLSRALNIGDYVKNGKPTATISIGIHLDAADRAAIQQFTREIDADGANRFALDGRRTSQSAFQRAVAALNIQVDNLCQFLPQDRVQDFAKQNAQELLASTQASVCAPEVEQAWQSLKEMRARQLAGSASLGDNAAKLAEAERLNEALESQLQTLQRRQQLQAAHEVCVKKRAWMEFEEQYVKYQELCEDLRQADANLARHAAAKEPLQQQIDAHAAERRRFEERIAAELATVDRSGAELQRLADRAGAVHGRMRSVQADHEHAAAANEERKRELNEATGIQQVLIEDLRRQRAAAGTDAERQTAAAALDARVAELRAESQRRLAERHEISEQLHASVKPQLLNAAQRIEAVQSIGDRKLELLRTRFEHAYRGTLWLRENRERFAGRVYEPMVLELNVRDAARNAKYIEALVPTRDLIAFVCERKEDMELMHRALRGERQLNVNIVHSAAAERCEYRAERPLEELREWGFHAYAIDLLEGPAPLLNAMCKNNRLHAVPVGDERTFEMAERLPGDVGLFFSTNHCFKITRSKYSKQKATTCTELHGSQLLHIGIDNAQLAQLKQLHAKLLRQSDTLNNDRLRLEAELRDLEERSSATQAERQQINTRTAALQQCNNKLRLHMQRLQRLPAPIDLQAERQKSRETIRRLWTDALRLQATAVPQYEALCAARHAHALAAERYRKHQADVRDTQHELQRLQDEVDKAQRLCERIRELHTRAKRTVRDKQLAAKQLTDGQTPSDDPAQFAWRERFDALPAQLDELVAHMDELQGEIDCLDGGGVAGESAAAEFEQRRRHIEQLREAIRAHGEEDAQLARRQDELYARWLPIVEGTVATINANFGAYMAAMQFAGEVALTWGADRRDYAEYGIAIRVKYRAAERLQTLDRNVQSGGERAVAIAVYSLALQRISHVPFRCVDEINQGMDATNERKIFDMLVEQTAPAAAAGEGEEQDGPEKSQYFFVTPKLLPNLAYNEAMVVHVVHNGRFVRDEKMFERRWE